MSLETHPGANRRGENSIRYREMSAYNCCCQSKYEGEHQGHSGNDATLGIRDLLLICFLWNKEQMYSVLHNIETFVIESYVSPPMK